MISNQYNYVREGVRMMANGLKVYHLPLLPVLRNDVAFLAIFHIGSILRQIYVSEHVDIIHGHLSTSVTMSMCVVIAKAMGIKTVVTEHTHFWINDLGSINLNKCVKWYTKDVDATIAVSHACKENFTLRARLNPY